MADGKVAVPYGRFLGYDKGETGTLEVNEEQAVIVRRIYSMFLQGMTPYGIAKTLTAEGIKSPGGKDVWGGTTVRHILMNEKYRGDALLQKTYTTDYLTKKKKVNEGEVPQYYVENNHECSCKVSTLHPPMGVKPGRIIIGLYANRELVLLNAWLMHFPIK